MAVSLHLHHHAGLLLSVVIIANAVMPPKIISHPPREIAYKSGERVELPCVATGDPTPEYRWTRSGYVVRTDGDVEMLTGIGTIVISYPNPRHEGIYQCTASNEFGTAVSSTAVLKMAVMEPFASTGIVPVHTPTVGQSLTLKCSAPNSYPKGIISWALVDAASDIDKSLPYKSNEFFQALPLDARVAVDYSGSLHFANVIAEDEKLGKFYGCTLYNHVFRGFVQGDDQIVRPSVETGAPAPSPVKVLWHSDSINVVLNGSHAAMKCIFAGYPTPKVSWQKVGGKIADKASIRSSGLELIIPTVDASDVGVYRCSAHNTAKENAISVDITLDVQSLPVFTQEPQDVAPLEDEDAEFKCEATGIPTPVIQWTINGKPIEELPADSHRTISADGKTISYKGVVKETTQVLQCKAFNIHGYVFENAVLNVISLPPEIETVPQEVIRQLEGTDLQFTCAAKGAPKPTLAWKVGQDMADVAEDERISVETTGTETTLTIKNAEVSDSGAYYCVATNKYGSEEAFGTLVIKQKTVITDPPTDDTATAGTDVTLTCGISVDPSETSTVTVTWTKDGEEVSDDSRYSQDLHTHSLHIMPVAVSDSGRFKCHVKASMDEAEAEASLLIQDRPEPPVSVQLTCDAEKVEVAWTAGSDNNAAISSFTVFYSSSDGEEHEVRSEGDGATVMLSFDALPITEYSVSVVADNEVGRSDRSVVAKCKTKAAPPTRHPDGVCLENGASDELIVVWNVLPQSEHQGEHMQYEVHYRKNSDDSEAQHQTVTDWKQHRLVISGQPVFTQFEVYVVATNEAGPAAGSANKVLGYTGEGVPQDSPANVEAASDQVNATSATVSWQPVDESSERVQGHMRGYRVVYWEAGSNERRSVDHILYEVSLCTPVEGNNDRRKRETEALQQQITDLKPFTDYRLSVSVLILTSSGPLSDPISFKTAESVPGPLSDVKVVESASHHLVIEWAPPKVPNGIIKGYVVKYGPKSTDDAATAPSTAEVTIDANTLRRRLTSLVPSTEYVIQVWAFTSVGNSDEATVSSGMTVDDINPDVPAVGIITASLTHANVTWQPSSSNVENPGSEFYVEFRKGDGEYQKTDKVTEPHWINVTGLDEGFEYEFRVVAISGSGKESRSNSVKQQIGPAPVIATASSPMWIILIIIAILALLVLVVAVIFIMRRNRGQKYPVHEKERLHGHDLDDEEKQEFGEYVRSEPKNGKGPNGNLLLNPDLQQDSDEDNDSMDDYSQMDPAKFNEDGSFIGQYGGYKRGQDIDASGPNGLSTFV